MKKLLGIIVLGLLMSGNVYAEEYWSNFKNGPTSEQEAKIKFFNNQKLDKLEGIWFMPGSGTVAITKSKTNENRYLIYLIQATENRWEKYNGTLEGTILKTSDYKRNPVFLRIFSSLGDERTKQKYIQTVYDKKFTIYKKDPYEYDAEEASRIWPSNLKTYNSKFIKKKPKKEIKKEIVKKNIEPITQAQATDKYFKDKDLESIEGVWMFEYSMDIIFIYKDNDKYICKVIRSTKFQSGENLCDLTKGSNTTYYGRWNYYNKELKDSWSETTIDLREKKKKSEKRTGNLNFMELYIGSKYQTDLKRLYPESVYAGSSGSKTSGSAFFVTSNGHIVTNHHVIESCNDQSKIMYDNKEYPAKLLASDKKLDLALLKVDLKNKGYLNFSYEPNKMQKIYAAGYPLGKYLSDDLKFTDGIVSSLKGLDDNTNQIQISAAINPGNSGGPIVNQSAELVGVAVSGLDKGLTEGINFAIKSESVKTFLNANKVEPSTSFFSREFKNDRILSILEKATVYTFCN